MKGWLMHHTSTDALVRNLHMLDNIFKWFILSIYLLYVCFTFLQRKRHYWELDGKTITLYPDENSNKYYKVYISLYMASLHLCDIMSTMLSNYIFMILLQSIMTSSTLTLNIETLIFTLFTLLILRRYHSLRCFMFEAQVSWLCPCCQIIASTRLSWRQAHWCTVYLRIKRARAGSQPSNWP